MSKPYYFRDIESLGKFLKLISRRDSFPNGDVPSFQVNGVNIDPNNYLDSATEVAKLPLPQRGHLAIQGTFPNHIGGLSIIFQQRGPNVPPQTFFFSETSINADADAQSLATSITQCASPIPVFHRRAKVPIIEPIHAGDEARKRHDLEVAKKARRNGGVWGAITGFAVASIPVFAQWLATR